MCVRARAFVSMPMFVRMFVRARAVCARVSACLCVFLRVCVRADCVFVYARAWVRACVRACVRAAIPPPLLGGDLQRREHTSAAYPHTHTHTHTQTHEQY